MLSILSCSTNMFAQYLFYGYTYYKGLYNISIESYKIGFGEYLPEGTDKAILFERWDVITSNNNYNNTYLDLLILYYKGYEANYENNVNNIVLPILNQILLCIVSVLSLIIFIIYMIYMVKIKILNKRRRKYENEKIIYNNTNV